MRRLKQHSNRHLILAVVWLAGSATADRFNGFSVSNATIGIEHILSGGPPRDGIPSIDRPTFIAPAEAGYMRDNDEVVSISRGDATRAYPLRILVGHEIVNDIIADEPVVVTYCPLCGTAMFFSRQVNRQTLDFGVSGLLYQSDVLMYDRQTESLWSQLAMKAVAGPNIGAQLEWMPSERLTWSAWRTKYPKGKVLSTDTGFGRSYSAPAYIGYKKSLDTMFPVPSHRKELPKKEWVIGVVVHGTARAYPVDALPPNQIIRDTVNDITIEVTYHDKLQWIDVREDGGGKALPSVKVYWFAWQAFYPETELWSSPPKENEDS